MVSTSNAGRLEGLFDKQELLYALKQLNNDKTSGFDGLSKEFMLQYWELLADWVLDMVNEAWSSQSLDP